MPDPRFSIEPCYDTARSDMFSALWTVPSMMQRYRHRCVYRLRRKRSLEHTQAVPRRDQQLPPPWQVETLSSQLGPSPAGGRAPRSYLPICQTCTPRPCHDGINSPLWQVETLSSQLGPSPAGVRAPLGLKCTSLRGKWNGGVCSVTTATLTFYPTLISSVLGRFGSVTQPTLDISSDPPPQEDEHPGPWCLKCTSLRGKWNGGVCSVTTATQTSYPTLISSVLGRFGSVTQPTLDISSDPPPQEDEHPGP
jgi:hypothetical protein